MQQQVVQILSRWLQDSQTNVAHLAPFGLHTLYQSAVALLTVQNMNGSIQKSHIDSQLTMIKLALKLMNRRWRAAATYLSLIERYEMGYSEGAITLN
ncbi:hypothetical protein CI102_8439 [Trichoderma harzianum]|nr:hypothetical protein CI102_8439 [Trichoderma harzianum]